MPTITEKIIQKHLVERVIEQGKATAIRIDQALTQDAIGTMTYLQLETTGMNQARTDLSISYVDHNTLQSSFENADDHEYLQTVAVEHGVHFSRPGNGICHQVHPGRSAKPQATLLGSDSCTPATGGMGALAIEVGGPDVACAMTGMPFHLNTPDTIDVRLHGSLTKGVSPKDIILKVLQILSIRGGVESIIEYSEGDVRGLSIPQRITITNMEAELGATTSIFPSDGVTREPLKKQHRGDAYEELKANKDTAYDTVIDINLNTLESTIVMPHSPDNALPTSEVLSLKVDQVTIGSCTSSSYMGMMSAVGILKNKTIDLNVSLVIFPGSRQILCMISQNGGLFDMISAGTRILGSICGPCIGTGQSPIINVLFLRTFNRSFYGRGGTLSAKAYLVSPEITAASALYGHIVGPRTVEYEPSQEPEVFTVDDSTIIVSNVEVTVETEVARGFNIKPLPINTPLGGRIDKKVMTKMGNNITIDCIAPVSARVLPYRFNIEKISEFVLMSVKASFHNDRLEYGGGFIIVGANYEQGDSREHVTLTPMYLGVKAVIAESFARTHRTNLINFDIIPFTFSNEEDYDTTDELDELTITNLKSLTEHIPVEIIDVTKNKGPQVFYSLTQRDIETILAEGTPNSTRRNQGQTEPAADVRRHILTAINKRKLSAYRAYASNILSCSPLFSIFICFYCNSYYNEGKK